MLALGLAGVACAPSGAQGVAEHPTAPARPERPPLLAPMSGRYRITRQGVPAGEETFTITRTGPLWRVVGHTSLHGAVDVEQGYRLDVDAERAEPEAFEVWIEIAGIRERATGERRGDRFHVTVEAVSGKGEVDVPYGPGTVLDFATPIFNTLALSLLGPSLRLGAPIEVRTISLVLPTLRPVVVLQRYERHGDDGPLRKIAVGPGGAARPTALWVRADGLPVRVRTWPDGGGVPYEMRLEPSAELQRQADQQPDQEQPADHP